MKCAVDTNVIVSLLGEEPSGSLAAERVLDEARGAGALVVCGVVYSELLAHPQMTSTILERLLADTGIEPEFDTGQTIWQEAGFRYARYANRRRKEPAGAPRRLLADFLVGVHALLHADRLVTFDGPGFRRDFPELAIVPASRRSQ